VATLRRRPTLPQIVLKGTDKRPYEIAGIERLLP
jgi:hypothetical protein